MTLIMRLRYPHKKQIKTDYETQFSTDPILNDKIKKNSIKKKHRESTGVNSLNIISGF
jgi:hypothetical protein